MKLKNIFNTLSLAAVALVATGCQDTDAQTDVLEVDAPVLVSVTPDETGLLLFGEKTITVTFDKNIGFATKNASKITLNGKSVKSANVAGVSASLTIKADVDFEKTQKLHIPAGLIVGPQYKTYDKDIDKDLIGPEYLPAWEKFGLFGLKSVVTEPTIRAYSMANYPAEGDRIMLTVRIATPPFKPKPEVGFQDVPTGVASSYIFSLKPGDKVIMSGPYGEFHPIFDSKKEMIWVGGGAGMAPLRAQIMHMTKTLKTTDREMHYFYGARALNEVFYLQDFLGLEKEFPNFHFHLALDRPDPAADAAGVKYTPGFVHNVMYETYLKDHEAPEDIEYYMCGPGPMSKAVTGMLDNLGVDPASIMYDNFGG